MYSNNNTVENTLDTKYTNLIKTLLQRHENDTDMHVSEKEKNIFRDKYTKDEIDNMMSSLLSGINWKQEIDSFSNIEKIYPTPEKGDTVLCLDTGKVYTYNGIKWVISIINVINLATKDVSGLLSKDDKDKLDNIEDNANCYIHPDDEQTRHVTDDDIYKWNSKADKNLVTDLINGLMRYDDKKKLDNIEDNANYYKHPNTHSANMIRTDSLHRFVTDEQMQEWDEKESVIGSDEKILAATYELKKYVQNLIYNLSSTSPELFNTLKSMKTYLNNDDIGNSVLKRLGDLVEKESFTDHIEDNNIHLSSDTKRDISYLKKVLSSAYVDWNCNNDQDMHYIKNKPESLPANGGNADTVGGYSKSQLMKNKRSNTITIGTSRCGHSLDTVDYLCDNDNDTEIIQKAIDELSINGGKITILEGTYYLKNCINIDKNNITLEGLGYQTIIKTTSDFDGKVLLELNGNYNKLQNIKIISDQDSYIELSGSYNNITDIYCSNSGIKLLHGSYNNILNNTCKNIKKGITINTTKSESNLNKICNNRLIDCNIGIELTNNKYSLISNIIESNMISDCINGIIVSCLDNSINKNNVIISNHITHIRSKKNDSSIKCLEKVYNIIKNNIVDKSIINIHSTLVDNFVMQ